ncbi:glycerate kinase [Leifsonia sp. fls2-241-R2A-40a]|uniref:glycerate kinase n=1 Tax=Leifsonia sp. fls2-241-R2A-40a TaxID=3040290 RepID=UPI0025509265|nr:glycerate kinase [Leifsonia sp. fls2-241-R2A-40a]
MNARIVVAPDSFKGSAGAEVVAAAVADGWRSVRPSDEVIELPMADGGEGTVDAFLAAVPGAIQRTVVVDGPDNRPVTARWALLPAAEATPGGTAVIEVAQTSGLGLLDPLRPLHAHTRGLGQAIAAALDGGVSRVLVGLGGSATTDGGAGALVALGARLTTRTGADIADGNTGLGTVAAVDLSGLRPAPEGGVVLLTDVRSPLLGERGAARVFGPQKGASPGDVEVMEVYLENLVRRTAEHFPSATALSERPGAGAAGGTGFGLSLWGATIRVGADEIAAQLKLPEAVRAADLVITGEGRYDEQTGEGKVAARVASLAREADVPVALVAGLVAIEPQGFADRVELTSLAGSAAASLADAANWARRAGGVLAARWRG